MQPDPIHPFCELVAEALTRLGYERSGEIAPGIVEFERFNPRYHTVAVPMGAYADANDLIGSLAVQKVDMAEFVEVINAIRDEVRAQAAAQPPDDD